MDSRITGIVLATACAAIILFSMFNTRWLRGEFDGAKVSVGLRQVSVCKTDECISGSVSSCEKPAKAATGLDSVGETSFMSALLAAPPHCTVLIGGSIMAAVTMQAGRAKNQDDLRRRLDSIPHMNLSTYLLFARLTFILGLVAGVLLLVCAGLALARRFVYWPITPNTLALFALILLFITGPVCIAVNPFKGMGVAWGFWLFGLGATGGLAGGIMLGRLRPADDPIWDDLESDDPES